MSYVPSNAPIVIRSLTGDLSKSTAVISFSPSEDQVFGDIFRALQASADSLPAGPKIQWSDVDVVLQVLARWPEAQRYPRAAP